MMAKVRRRAASTAVDADIGPSYPTPAPKANRAALSKDRLRLGAKTR